MRDLSGVELPDLEAAREEARHRAFLTLTDGYKLGQDRRGWLIDVRDEAGRVVLTLTLDEAISQPAGSGAYARQGAGRLG